MKLRITIEDEEGGILSTRTTTKDELIELDALDWNEHKEGMIHEAFTGEELSELVKNF